MNMTENNPIIGIAGAGIAGLTAGLELQHAGSSVSIFEARSRTGGRIYSFDLAGTVVEAGPEFIHGYCKETIGLLRKYKIPYEPVKGKMYAAYHGLLKENYEFVAGWDQLLKKMKYLKKDLPFGVFLEEYFPGNYYNDLKKSAVSFAEGFDLADTEKVSTRSLFIEWREEDNEQYRIPAGYTTLISSLEEEFISGGGKIFLNHPVHEVESSGREVHIQVDEKRRFKVDKMIICLPFSAFNQMAPSGESIIFIPAIDEKNAAVDPIGFGTVVKIVLIWKSEFWKTLIPDARFIFSDQFIPTWWTQYPNPTAMLTGWLGGSKALQYSDRSEDFFLEKALESLSGIFSVSIETLRQELQETRVFNWKKEPWSRGAYSYSKVGYEKAKKEWRKPQGGNIYFAGEAYYEGPFQGTVEAAVVNGMAVARQLLSDIL
jgi:monoamine oxidase